MKVIKGSFNIAKSLGYTANLDDDLSALYNANPGVVLWGHLVIDCLPLATNTVGIQVWGEFTFHCKFYKLAQVTDSVYVKKETDKDDDEQVIIDSG